MFKMTSVCASDNCLLGNGVENETSNLKISTSDNGSQFKKKRGIIYLSTIPPFMNVAKIRETFGQYGVVGRVYLQLPKRSDKQKKKNMVNLYTEGWVEFESKNVAKKVADFLNNTKIGTRKKSRYYDMIWNIKYIPRFKWVHLSERLAYERAVHKQRMRTEIAQAKKEASFLQSNVDMSRKLKKKNV